MKHYLFLLLFAFGVMPSVALADIGPKPTMSFTFENLPANTTIIDSKLFECSDMSCSDITPFREMGPQRFSCGIEGTAYVCFSMAYNFEPYHKISITFSDKARTSNVFSLSATDEWDSFYTISVRENDLLVEPISTTKARMNEVSHRDDPSVFSQKNFFETGNSSLDPFGYFFFMLLALVITLCVELVVVIIYRLIKRTKVPRLLTILLANLISLPLLWATAYVIDVNYYLFIIIGEIAVVAFEAWLISIFAGGIATWKRWIPLALIMNAISFFIGDLIISNIPNLIYIILG